MSKSIIRNPERLIQFVRDVARSWDWSKPMLVKIDELRRNEIQSRKFHAMCRDVSEQSEWAGKKRTEQEWKVLFVSGHTIATKNDVEMVRGIEGELLNIRESTANMGVRRMASLIEYVSAWCAVNEITLRADEYYDNLPESQTNQPTKEAFYD